MGGGGQQTALITDGSLRQSLVAVRSLGRAGVPVEVYEPGASAPAFFSRHCSAAEILPDVADAPDAFADALRERALRHEQPVILTSHDGVIDILCARRSEFQRFAHLALADDAALGIATDKRRTLSLASELGIPVPVSVVVGDAADIASAGREVGLPAVVKPVRSWTANHGAGVRVVPAVYWEMEKLRAQAEALIELEGAVILQPWLCGAREAVSVIYAAGEITTAFAQVAHRVHPLLGGTSVMRESIPLYPDLAGPAEKLIGTIGLEGYSEIEFRRDAQGTPRLMEINPRLSASVEVAVRSGVDFPLFLYDWARGAKLPKSPGYRLGVRMRWLGGDVRWLAETFSHHDEPDARSRSRALAEFGRDFFHPTFYDYVDRRDLMPALAALRGFFPTMYDHLVSPK